MAVSIAYSSIQPNGTARPEFTDEDDDVSLAAFLTPSWGFDQEKLTYDVLANQQYGVSVNPDWASLYTDPSVDKPTRPQMRTRTSSNSSKESSSPLTPVGQSHPQLNGSAKIANNKPASPSIAASTSPSSPRSYQSTAASETSSVRRVSAASPLSRTTSSPAIIASSNGASPSVQSSKPNSNGDVSAFGDELAHNFLHPRYQEQRRGSITSVKSEMSTKSLGGKLSFTKRLRRVLSMNNMKDNDGTESIRDSSESIHSTTSESSVNPSLRFIANRNTRFSQLSRSSIPTSTSAILSNQRYDDDTASESHITTSVNSGGSVRASLHPPRPGTPQPMLSRRRSLGNLGSLFSRNQAGHANLEEGHVVSDAPSLTPKVAPQSTKDRSFASIVKRRHSSGDLKFLVSEREKERDSTNQVESKKMLSKDDSSAGRNNSGTAVKDKPLMLRHDSLEARDPVRGILKGSSAPNRLHLISSYEPTQQRDLLAQSNSSKQRPQSQSISPANVPDEPLVHEAYIVQLTELQPFPDSVSSYPSSMSNSPVRADYFSTSAVEFSQDHLPIYLPSPRPEPSTSTGSARSRRSNTAPTIPTLSKNIRTPRLQRSLQFAPSIQIHETHASGDYDRRCDVNVTCAKLTPLIAMKIKQELNEYKLKEMDVHNDSRIYTHFFL